MSKNTVMSQRVQAESIYYDTSGAITDHYYTTRTVEYDVVQSSGPVKTVKSASGWRPPTNYSAYYAHNNPSSAGTVTVTTQRQGQDPTYQIETNGYTDGVGYPLSLPEIPDDLESRALIKALSKLKQQKVNLSVAFGERREAAEMMAHSVVSIAKTIRNFKHGFPRDWAAVKKFQTGLKKATGKEISNIPNRWLEVQYGWKPLMQDVHGAVSALENRERDADAYRATVTGTVFEKSESLAVIPATQSLADWKILLKREVGFKVRLDYVLENPVLATLSQLGVTNPAELAWELVPYSFVVDWFLPVGNWLSSLDAALGWSLKGGSGTVWQRQQGHSPLIFRPESIQWVYGQWIKQSGNGNGDYSERQFKMNRKVYTTSPLPRFPGIKNPLSTGHVANAMSLLVSAFR